MRIHITAERVINTRGRLTAEPVIHVAVDFASSHPEKAGSAANDREIRYASVKRKARSPLPGQIRPRFELLRSIVENLNIGTAGEIHAGSGRQSELRH